MADKKISQLTGATTPLGGTEEVPLVQSSTTKKVSVNNLTVGRNVETAELTAVKTSAGALVDALVVRNESTTANAETGIFFEPTANIGKIRGARISAVNDGGNVIGLKFYTGAGAAITNKLEIEGATTGNVTFKTGNLVQGTAAKGVNFTANTPAAGMTSQLLNWYEEGTWTPVDASGAGLSFTSASGHYTRIGRTVTVVFTLVYPTTANANAARIGGLPFTAANTNNGFNNGTFNINSSGQNIQPSIVANATNFAALLVATGTSATNVQLTGATLRGGLTYFV